MTDVESERIFRITFEFERTDQVETFLEKLAANIDSGTLKITGKWSWSAEQVETFMTTEPENDDDDD